MAKNIKFTYKDTDYTLEYTRRSIREMEDEGFNIELMETKPVTMIPLLFAGAFKANHRRTTPKLIDEIYGVIPNKMEFISKLAELYSEPLLSLIDDPTDSEGNISWTASW